MCTRMYICIIYVYITYNIYIYIYICMCRYIYIYITFSSRGPQLIASVWKFASAAVGWGEILGSQY